MSQKYNPENDPFADTPLPGKLNKLRWTFRAVAGLYFVYILLVQHPLWVKLVVGAVIIIVAVVITIILQIMEKRAQYIPWTPQPMDDYGQEIEQDNPKQQQ